MHVLIVGLEKPNCQVMIEQRRLVVESAANRQRRSPLVRLEERAVHLVGAHQCVRKRGDVSIRIAYDQTAAEAHESIVVAVRTDVGSR